MVPLAGRTGMTVTHIHEVYTQNPEKITVWCGIDGNSKEEVSDILVPP